MKPRIAVVGVGGAGGNAINNMIAAGLSGAQFMVANTDAQALVASSAEVRIQLGSNLTEGLGAGSKPEIGEAAAEEALEEIRAAVSGCHMVFIAAGMGGGTGTGAASVIARIAKESNILTVAVVTKPFLFEGSRRMRVAEAGIAELKNHVDTLLVIPNQNLFRVATDRTTFAEAFVLADQVLYSGIACIVDLIVKEGLINLDLADVRTVLIGMGTAMMGTGEAAGEQRAIVAAEEAIVNPLLDDVTLKGAKSLLLSITGGNDLTLWEVDEAANRVRQEVDPDANIIVGATFDEALGDRVRVSIVASGMTRSVGVRASRDADDPARASGASRSGRPAGPTSEDHRRHATEAVGGTASHGESLAGAYDTPGQRQPSMLSPATRAPAARARNGFDVAPEAKRQAPRMPSVDDFPPVAQREYWAKTGDANGRAAQSDVDPIMRHAPESPAPKTSLLRRLTGGSIGRRDTPAAVEPGTDDPDPRQGQQFAEDNVDLPVFFGRKKR
jgi:cell division protein FtsZ